MSRELLELCEGRIAAREARYTRILVAIDRASDASRKGLDVDGDRRSENSLGRFLEAE